MAALAEAARGSGMCRAGCALPARSCGSGRAAPWVCKTCAVVCAEAQRCFGFFFGVLFWFFPCEGAGCCREGGTAAFSQRREGLRLIVPCVCVSLPSSSSSSVLAGSGSVENKRQTVRTKHNTFPWRERGGEEKKTPHCQAGFKTLPCGLCAPLWGCSSGSHGGPTTGPSAPSLRDASSPARPSRCQRCSRLPGFTLAPNHNLRVNSEETVTLLLANRH